MSTASGSSIESRPPMDRKRWIFPVLVLALLLFRLAVLLTTCDWLYEPEELYRGTIAHEIASGRLILPLWEYLDYKVEYFPGGTLVVGALAAPLFLLFGHTYVSLKLVGLLFAVGTFATWFVFLRSFFNLRSAVISCLLFIFCVPLYTKTSLITWGAHPEANLFTILALFLFFSIMRATGGALSASAGRSRGWLPYFLLGLLTGFSLWFVQTFLLTVLYLFILWFALDNGFFRRRGFLIFLVACAIGSLPSLYYECIYHGGVLNINGHSVINDLFLGDLNAVFPKAWRFLTSDLPRSFLFQPFAGIKAGVYAGVYYALFLVSCVSIAWARRREAGIMARSVLYPITLRKACFGPAGLSPEAALLVYPLVFLFCYSLSSYSVSPEPWENPELWLDYIGYRYMIPLLPFIFALLGIFIAGIRRKAVAVFFFAVVVAAGIAGNAGLIIPGNFGKFLTDKGYSYNIIGDKIGLRITTGISGYIRPYERLEPELKQQFFEGLGAGIAWRLRAASPESIIASFTEIETGRRDCLYRGWGTLFSPEITGEFTKAVEVAGNIAPEFRGFFYEGFGRNMGFLDNIDQGIALIERVEERYRGECYAGLGYVIGFEYEDFPELRERLLLRIGEGRRELVASGILRGMRER